MSWAEAPNHKNSWLPWNRFPRATSLVNNRDRFATPNPIFVKMVVTVPDNQQRPALPPIPSLPGSISRVIATSGQLDEESAQLLWDRFFERLCRFATGKIYQRHRRHVDPEDIASSAMLALMDGLNDGRFQSVENRDQLWQMLVMIAARKSINKGKHLDRKKRGGKKAKGGSAFNGDGINNLVEFIDHSEDPAKLVEVEFTCRELLSALPNDNYREIALMRLSGFNNQEIGDKLGCSTRTIDRKLLTIREVWTDVGLD